MTELLLIRHGTSVYNQAKIYTGQSDVTLTEKGLKQAEKTAEYIAENYKVDKIVSSDLIRCIQTIKPLADKLGLPVETNGMLREIDGGLWEGKHLSEIEKLYPEDYRKYVEDIGNSRCTGGESFAELRRRSFAAIDGIARANEGKSVVISTHGGVIISFISEITGVSLAGMQTVEAVTNNSVTLVAYTGGRYEILKRGYDAHLGDLKNAETEKGLR